MKLTSLLIALAVVGATSCSSTRYGDPTDEETLNVDYGSTDRQRFADTMINSLLESPGLRYMPNGGDDPRLKIYMGGVDNRTSEHIDTLGITDAIRVSLMQSGRFRFVTPEQGQEELAEQVRFQQGSGRVDPNQAKAFGKQLGADVILFGRLFSIEKKKGRSFESGGVKTERTDYQFVLEAVNIETAETIWIEQREITKTQKTGLFG